MVEGKVTLTLSQVDELRNARQSALNLVEVKDKEIKNLKDAQRKVVSEKWNYSLKYSTSDYLNLMSMGASIYEKSFNLQLDRQAIIVTRNTLMSLAKQLIDKKMLVEDKELVETSYINFEDVNEQLRTEMEIKMEQKYQKEIAEAKAARETLNSQIARSTAHHQEEILNLKDAHQKTTNLLQSTINEWEIKYTALEIGKKEENRIKDLQDLLEKTQEKLAMYVNRPWWKFWI